MSSSSTLPAAMRMTAAPPAGDSRTESRRLAAWAAAMALLGWALMTLGAFVRASESGLGCPDWPACHGSLVAGGHHAMIEELHRWVAATLILGTVGLATAIFRFHRQERRLTRPMAWVLALLALQAVLGGVTVILHNVSWTVVAHYGTAALLVASIALLAVRLTFPSAKAAPRDSFSRVIDLFAALSFGLLLAGSTVANTDSHTACGRGFPLCNGSLLPSLDHHLVLNMTHRVWAATMLLFALWVLLRSRRERAGVPAVKWAAAAVALLYLMQAGLGIAVVGLGENTALEVAHSSLGSLTWVALMLLLALTRTLQADLDPRGRSSRSAVRLRSGPTI
jgi:cytochrome c oxidase assembly protein subunit 15